LPTTWRAWRAHRMTISRLTISPMSAVRRQAWRSSPLAGK
jgi:hypothetical protein